MNDRFVACLADTLLPGDGGTPPLPCATEVGAERAIARLLEADDGASCRRAVRAVARAAGDAHAFVRATADLRAAAVADAERTVPADLRALVTVALEAYYQSEPVILAMGWTARSPQPVGHPVEPLDLTLLGPVKERPPMWRPGVRT